MKLLCKAGLHQWVYSEQKSGRKCSACGKSQLLKYNSTGKLRWFFQYKWVDDTKDEFKA